MGKVVKKALLEEYEENIDEKIKSFYDNNIKKANVKDKNGIIASYIDDIFNPDTSKLDKYNLLLNHIIISNLLDLKIMNFYFDETVKKYSTSEYFLELYKDIKKGEDEKFVDLLIKKFNLAFYRAMFEANIKKADRIAYSENNLKMKSLWDIVENVDEPELDLEEYFVEFLHKKTVDGSVVMVTPDLVKYFELDVKNEEIYDEKPFVKYLGIWKERFVYEIDTEQITNLKGFKKGAFFIKDGNSYIINPDKPIVYFNTVDNMFLEKPILKLFASIDFDFKLTNTKFLKVEI